MVETDTNKAFWKAMTPLEPIYSASVLISLLQKDEFENGKHLDIFDL